MQRMSLFIISMIVVSMTVLSFGVYYGGISTYYNEANTQNVSQYSQLNNISLMTDDLTAKINEQPTSTGGFAVGGDFLSYAYNTFRLVFGSYDLFYAIMENGFNSVPLSDGGNGATIGLLKIGLGSIVMIIIAFIIISIISGRQDL